MKKWPLFLQITAVFSGLIVCTALVLLLLLPITLNNFFTEEVFSNIKNAQQFFVSKNKGHYSGEIAPEVFHSIRTVNHTIVNENGKIIKGSSLNALFIKRIIANMKLEDKDEKRFSIPNNKDTIFIVAKNVTEKEKSYYIISYMLDTYRNELVATLFKRILLLMGMIIIISLLISFAVAKRLTKPIILMKKHVKKIANRNWNDTLHVNRKDELGELASSIEEMRKQLIHQDKAQQSYLQNISHDLKTPVMVIQSYSQAIQDGIYIKGSLKNTTEVIQIEAKRLEHKINDLLYLTKLQYLETKAQENSIISFRSFFKDIFTRMKHQRKDIKWLLPENTIEILGNKEQLIVAFENILTNSLRYAKSNIQVTISSNGQVGKVVISNDGPPIKPELLKNIFEPFIKGSDGNFGLGLAIAKKVITTHNGSIIVTNEQNGVHYEITLPMNE